MFKTNIKQFSLINWMVFNGHTPKNLSKTDLIQIMTFITYYNSGDFTTILPKKLINKVVNGLISDGNITAITSDKYGCIIGCFNLYINYEEKTEIDFTDNPKELLKFKKRVLLHTINQPQYN